MLLFTLAIHCCVCLLLVLFVCMFLGACVRFYGCVLLDSFLVLCLYGLFLIVVHCYVCFFVCISLCE